MTSQIHQNKTPPDIFHSEDLPVGWKLSSLSDGLVVDVQPGFACGEHNREGLGIRHLRPMNVHESGRIDLSLVKYVPESKAARQEVILQRGDVLFNNTNSPELVGKTAYYDLSESATFSNHMTRVRCNASILDPKYCAIALHQNWREGYFRNVCNNHVSQSSVSRSVLLETPLLVPPLPEQKRIVAKIEELLPRVNAVRERLIRVREIMKRFRQSILSAACSGRLTEDWRGKNLEIETASDLLERIKKRRRGGDSRELNISAFPGDNLPESWVECNLGSLSELITKGSSPNWQGMNYAETGTLFVTSENVGLGDLVLKNRKYVEERFNKIQKRSILKRGDLLTNIVGASIGRSAIFDLDEEANINQAVALIRLESEVDKKYILDVLNSPLTIDLMNRTKVDVARANLSLSDVSNLPVPLPPISEQKEIVLRVDSLFNLADKIEKRIEDELSRTKKMTQAILAKAFRGELVSTEAELGRREERVGG